MDTFQTESTPVMESFNFQPAVYDPSLGGNIDMTAMGMFPDGMQIDMASLPPSTFEDAMPGIPSLSKEPSSNANSSENITLNGVGAGPLPTGFVAQNAMPSTSSNVLTEFTKRRNWSQRVLDELKDLLYILTSDGRLLYLSPSAKLLLGYDPTELVGKSISEFVHPDDASLFIREFNESIATGNILRLFHRFRTAEDKYRIFECHGHPHLSNDSPPGDMSVGPASGAPFCRGFFMMARPYPSKNSELLDSFLEHKIENVRLLARIAALKREEAEDAEAQHDPFHKQAGTNGVKSRSNSVDMTPASPSMVSKDDAPESSSMPPPAKPTLSNVALTREALDEANAQARPDSIRDKMARYEGSSHVDSIEMFTGLRYREGERSQGISTGGTSPALIRGDAGIHIPIDKADARYGGSSYSDKKAKKVKSADEFVCTDCGTLDSPEWRKGPNGPKTLCNACGLRWAKKEKKRSGDPGVDGFGASENGGVADGIS